MLLVDVGKEVAPHIRQDPLFGSREWHSTIGSGLRGTLILILGRHSRGSRRAFTHRILRWRLVDFRVNGQPTENEGPSAREKGSFCLGFPECGEVGNIVPGPVSNVMGPTGDGEGLLRATYCSPGYPLYRRTHAAID